MILTAYYKKGIFCLNLSIGIEDLPQEFYIENSVINVEFLNNRTGEITAGAYLVSITEIVSDCQQIGTGALLIINSYILGLLWEKQCFFLFDSHSKDKTGRVSATGTAVLLKFDSLQSLENYIKSVYYSNYPMTLYFQIQFLKLKCTEKTKSTIKSALKCERKKKVSSLKKKYQEQEKKMQGAKERYYRQSLKDSIEKGNIRKILNKKKIIKKRNTRKTLHQKKNMEKRNTRKILNQKENMKKANMRKILNIKKFIKKKEVSGKL